MAETMLHKVCAITQIQIHTTASSPFTKTKKSLRDLVYANHILHYHGAVDAYGHVSIRHPEKSDIYIMSGYLAPALVESPNDLIEYHISDGSPVSPHAKKGYQERFIHGEIFKRYPEVNCVVHSHAEEVLPYTINGVSLRPAFHMAGFLGMIDESLHINAIPRNLLMVFKIYRPTCPYL